MGGSEDTGCRAGHCDGWPLCGSLPCAKFTDRQYREGAALGARGNAAREAGTLSHPPERQRRARRNGGRAGMPSRDAWDPDTGPLRETRALPYRRFMNDAAMCRNLAFRRHANADVFGDHAAATVTTDAPPVTPNAPPGRGDCFAREISSCSRNVSQQLQDDTEDNPAPAVAGCRAGRAARKRGLFRQKISSCSRNVSQQLQNDTENNPAPAVAGCRAGRGARKRGLFRQKISSCSRNVSQQLQNDTENNPAPAVAGCRAGRAAGKGGLFRQEISSCSGNVSQQLQNDTENNPTPAGGGASRYAADTSLSWPVAQS